MKTPMVLFLCCLFCLLIGTILWFSSVSWLNYVLPCGEACAPTEFERKLLGIALVYCFVFPFLIAPILIILSIITLVLSLFCPKDKGN